MPPSMGTLPYATTTKNGLKKIKHAVFTGVTDLINSGDQIP